jgi:hypothetical protein
VRPQSICRHTLRRYLKSLEPHDQETIEAGVIALQQTGLSRNAALEVLLAVGEVLAAGNEEKRKQETWTINHDKTCTNNLPRIL